MGIGIRDSWEEVGIAKKEMREESEKAEDSEGSVTLEIKKEEICQKWVSMEKIDDSIQALMRTIDATIDSRKTYDQIESAVSEIRDTMKYIRDFIFSCSPEKCVPKRYHSNLYQSGTHVKSESDR